MATIAVRVRHPRGVTTVELEPSSQTVDDLKVLIFSATEIPPSEQEIKYGYPPKPLPHTDGPLSSIPITKGEQIIVTSVPASAQPAPIPSVSTSDPAPSVKPMNDALSAPSPLAEQDVPVESAESVALPGRDAGYLQLRVIPDDNSCLFSAIGVVFAGGIDAAPALRILVAEAIRADPDTYSDAVLGQSRDQYIQKISQSTTWGGAIELSIFSKHYQTEISSFDVGTGRCDRFGEGDYDSRCILVYSGIHYDAVTLSPLPSSPAEFHQTVFPVSDDIILVTASKLVSQLKSRHYYTDTATFDLRCAVCGTGLKGEKGAREHAMQTGHVEFGEY